MNVEGSETKDRFSTYSRYAIRCYLDVESLIDNVCASCKARSRDGGRGSVVNGARTGTVGFWLNTRARENADACTQVFFCHRKLTR